VLLDSREVGTFVEDAHPVRISPPIDMVAAERWAGRMPLLDVPLPDERVLQSWRLGDGSEVTQAALFYADPADAARLESLAGTLLGTGLGLYATPLLLPGSDAAVGWRGAGFTGASFRRERFVVIVGVTSPDAEAARSPAARALAERALTRVEAVLAAATASSKTAAPATPGTTPAPGR
jgi:hypothetical protein